MVLLVSLGNSQEESDVSLDGLAMLAADARSRQGQSSTGSSLGETANSPAPLPPSAHRPPRPPFRTQLSEPNWSRPCGSGPALLLHGICSPDSSNPLSPDIQAANVAALLSPEHFRREPFSVFYGGSNVPSAGVNSGTTLLCCGGIPLTHTVSMCLVDTAASKKNIQNLPPEEPSVFIFSMEASSYLTRLFRTAPADPIESRLRAHLAASMLLAHPVRVEKGRRSSLAPPSSLQTDSSGIPGQGHLAQYGPDSLFFCIGLASQSSRRNSFITAGEGGTTQQQQQQQQWFFGGGGGLQQNQAEKGGAEKQQQQPKQQKRKRAVITVDANSTQILIASDSVCRLFGLRDRSLIGKRLGQVFPVAPEGCSPPMTSGLGQCSPVPSTAVGPLLLQNVLFADSEQRTLRPAYGQPVDILDADGNRLVVSIWAYPLAGGGMGAGATNTGGCMAALRKNSAVLMRSPSAFGWPPAGPPQWATAVPVCASQPSSTAATGEDVSQISKVTPQALFNHNHSNNSGLQRVLSNSIQGQQTVSVDSSSLATTSSSSSSSSPSSTQSQRTAKGGSSQSSPSLNSLSVSSTATGGYSPQLKVLEEEQQQQQINCESPPSNPRTNKNNGLTARPSAPGELNELEASVGCKPTDCRLSAEDQQQQQQTASEPTPCSCGNREESAMVQARVQQRKGGPPHHHHHHQRNGEEKEDETAALVVIPINHGGVDEQQQSQQKGFLRRQYQCEILPNTSAGTAVALEKVTNGGSIVAAAVLNGCGPAANDGDNGGQQNGGGGERWLILMEPINAMFASATLGTKGLIFRADDAFAALLGYECTNLLFGTEIQRVIPSLNIGADWEAKEQLCCGSSIKHNGVPISVTVSGQRDQESGTVFSYEVRVRSLASINGVVTLTDSGLMHSYNENFFHELLGMQFGPNGEMDERIDGCDRKLAITDVIPHFFEYLEVAHFMIGRSREEQRQRERGDAAAADIPPAGEQSPHVQQHSFMPTVSHSSSCLFTQELATARRTLGKRSSSFYGGTLEMGDEGGGREKSQRKPEIIPGIFYGLARHVDGMMIPVKIEVSITDAHGGGDQHGGSAPHLFAVCIGFDRTMDWGISQLVETELQKQQQEMHSTPQLPHSSLSNGVALAAKDADGLRKQNVELYGGGGGSACAAGLYLADLMGSPAGTTLVSPRAARFSIGGNSLRECDSESAAVSFVVGSLGRGGSALPDDFLQSAELKMQEVSLDTLEDENSDAVRGEYSKHYDTFQLIGNGAFGSVKLAARKDSGLLAVSKFICKAKVLPESWVCSPKRGHRMVPIEVHLLENLHHPNIVRVLDVFENEKYYQLVMEKCGCGMDLFEFIEHQPKLDEQLISYIFRQIVSAVDYLHQNHIVHRDLKDENVIIDQSFGCKLIDFGSAAFFGEGIVFSTFCGTMEYCSPEVLNGNKYLGPELEMWSMGILLYTLVFFENPFSSPQQTMKAEIELPWNISEGLYQVLSWLLQTDPTLRATVCDIKRHWWLTQRVDPKQYSFKELLKNCERAQVMPPLYVSDLQNHLKNSSSACNNLAGVAITSALSAEAAAVVAASSTKKGQDGQQQMGIVSAR